MEIRKNRNQKKDKKIFFTILEIISLFDILFDPFKRRPIFDLFTGIKVTPCNLNEALWAIEISKGIKKIV